MFAGGLPALMLPVLFVFIFLGFPVSFALIATSFLFGLHLFGDTIGLQLYGNLLQMATNWLLSCTPPFIFMGLILERSGIAGRLFQALQLWIGRVPGGLSVATISMAAVLAASTGIVGTVEVVIGVMAVPTMMAYRYSRSLIAGTICAGGSLGPIIPPSLVAVIYASVAKMSIGKLFGAMVLPGLIMVGLFITYILLRCYLRPADGPPLPRDHIQASLGKKIWLTVTGLIPPGLLIAAVLGSILWGVASPTEAASVGAFGAVGLTIAYGRFTWGVFIDALRRTMLITAMVLLIVGAGTIFSSTLFVLGGREMVFALIKFLELGPTGVIMLFMTVVFLFGFVLDWTATVLICLPIFLPVIEAMRIDPMMFAVIMVIALNTAYLTPPFAIAIFYFRSIAPPEITYQDMYRGIVPFVALQVLTAILVLIFPSLATYIPSLLVTF